MVRARDGLRSHGAFVFLSSKLVLAFRPVCELALGKSTLGLNDRRGPRTTAPGQTTYFRLARLFPQIVGSHTTEKWPRQRLDCAASIRLWHISIAGSILRILLGLSCSTIEATAVRMVGVLGMLSPPRTTLHSYFATSSRRFPLGRCIRWACTQGQS